MREKATWWMNLKKKFDLLESQRADALLGGGAERTQKQHEGGKLTARERIEILVDENSFEEIFGFKVKSNVIYDQAFIHKSIQRKEHNERLEFLGDSVLNRLCLFFAMRYTSFFKSFTLSSVDNLFSP